VEGLAGILPAGVWERLVAAGVPRLYLPGRILMHQGDPADHVVVILEGRVKISRVNPDGNTLVLAVRGAGELVGELGLLNQDHRRSATVTAIDRCSTRFIPLHEFVAVVRAVDLERQLLQHVVQRLQEGEDVRAELATLPAPERVVRCLVRLAVPGGNGSVTGTGGRIDIGLNQAELAQAAGVHRSTAAEVLKGLREEGLVVTQRRRLVITDLPRLRDKSVEATG
jgi:CRP/FNR family cyclic AMP-dependent transcriptional regulator